MTKCKLSGAVSCHSVDTLHAKPFISLQFEKCNETPLSAIKPRVSEKLQCNERMPRCNEIFHSFFFFSCFFATFAHSID